MEDGNRKRTFSTQSDSIYVTGPTHDTFRSLVGGQTQQLKLVAYSATELSSVKKHLLPSEKKNTTGRFHKLNYVRASQTHYKL